MVTRKGASCGSADSLIRQSPQIPHPCAFGTLFFRLFLSPVRRRHPLVLPFFSRSLEIARSNLRPCLHGDDRRLTGWSARTARTILVCVSVSRVYQCICMRVSVSYQYGTTCGRMRECATLTRATKGARGLVRACMRDTQYTHRDPTGILPLFYRRQMYVCVVGLS